MRPADGWCHIIYLFQSECVKNWILEKKKLKKKVILRGKQKIAAAVAEALPSVRFDVGITACAVHCVLNDKTLKQS